MPRTFQAWERAHPRRKMGGSALIITMIIIIVSSSIAGALFSSVFHHLKQVNRQIAREKALHIAEAGVEDAARRIVSAGGYLPSLTTGAGSLGGYTYSFAIVRKSALNFSIYGTALVAGVKWTVAAEETVVPSWSKYMMWMKDNGTLYFTGGEEFAGHIHADNQLWFAEVGNTGAVFHGDVTSAAADFGGSTNLAQFAKGFLRGAAQGSLGEVGLVLEGATSIDFQGATMRITNERLGWSGHVLTIGEERMIYVKNSTSGLESTQPADVFIGGEVDGRITLVAENDINITNHLLLAQIPGATTNANDAIGLVARDDVWVTPEAPDNLYIHAAMIAAGLAGEGNRGNFGVLNFDSGAPRGALHVLGSIVQDQRGAVGTFDSSGPATGFFKSYVFDQRYVTDAPPYFPRVASKIDLGGWRDGPG